MRKHLICLFLLLSLLLTSCSAPRPSDGGEEKYVLTDDIGRIVTTPDQPHRVACLLGSFADLWQLAGGEVVATTSDAFDTFSLSEDGVVNLGGAHSPSLEKLLSADPDLVIASASTASHLSMRQTLEQLSIPIVYFDMDNFEDYLFALERCTRITERPDLYLQNGLALQESISHLKEEYRKQNFKKEKRILLLRASSTGVKVKGSTGTILGEMLLDFGTENIADLDTSLLEGLSLESILALEPYHIFVVTMGNDSDLALGVFDRLVSDHPAWASLMAVREGRVHMMDKTLFHQKPNARYLTSYETLYDILTAQ